MGKANYGYSGLGKDGDGIGSKNCEYWDLSWCNDGVVAISQ